MASCTYCIGNQNLQRCDTIVITTSEYVIGSGKVGTCPLNEAYPKMQMREIQGCFEGVSILSDKTAPCHDWHGAVLYYSMTV